MAILKIRLSRTVESSVYDFTIIGYHTPADLIGANDNENTDFLPGGVYEDWWYVNSAGYAQKYNPNRPPSKYPAPGRLILIPTTATDALFKQRGIK